MIDLFAAQSHVVQVHRQQRNNTHTRDADSFENTFQKMFTAQPCHERTSLRNLGANSFVSKLAASHNRVDKYWSTKLNRNWRCLSEQKSWSLLNNVVSCFQTVVFRSACGIRFVDFLLVLKWKKITQRFAGQIQHGIKRTNARDSSYRTCQV